MDALIHFTNLHTIKAISQMILAEIDWSYVIGPIIVYIYIELKSGGTGGFGGSDDGFG